MSDDPRLPYTVYGWHRNSTRTYHCPTAEWALKKLQTFRDAHYTGITITGPDGSRLTEADLNTILAADAAPEGGAPVDIDAPAAPALMA